MQSESRKWNSAKNVIFGYLNQILSLGLNFIGRTVFIQILGREYLGINGLFSDVLTMLSMADLGFGIAMSYSFYKPIANQDKEKIAALIHFYKRVYILIACATAVIGVMLVPFLKYIINMDSDIPYLIYYYLLFLANTIVSYFFVYKTSIINASQKNYLISKYQIIIRLVQTIVQICVLVVFRNYFIYLFIPIIGTLANNLLASHKAEQLYPEIRSQNNQLDSAQKKEITENMKSVFLYKISSTFLTGTDNMLISVIIGTVWVGIYSNYNLILKGINSVLAVLFNSVTASVGNLVVTENEEKRYEVFQTMNVISLILAAVITIVISAVINDLVFLWLGAEYVLSNAIRIAIVCNFYLANILRPIWSYREATGLYTKTKYIMVIAAAFNLILSIVGGYLYGIAGIIFASVISRVSTYCWYEPQLLFHIYFKKKTFAYYLAVLKNMLITFGVCILIDVLSRNACIDSWWKLAVKLLWTGALSLICVLGYYSRTSEFKIIWNVYFYKKLKKKKH